MNGQRRSGTGHLLSETDVRFGTGVSRFQRLPASEIPFRYSLNGRVGD